MSVKVSVIVPVYNTSAYLKTCLVSLVNQTLKEIEIICVNDGSTDNSFEILEEFAKHDKRIKILNQKNCGQSCARNAGVAGAQGEFIGFIDSDDWAAPEMFGKLYENALKYDSDISMCSIVMHDEETGKEWANDPYMTLNLFPSEFENRAFNFRETLDFLFRICVVPWNKIYKKDLLISGGITFAKGLSYEDNVFFLEAWTASERISLIKEPLVFYRKASAASVTKSDKKRLDLFTVLDLQEKILKKKNLYNEVEDYFKESKINTLKYWYKKIQDEEVKKEYYKKLSKIAKI